MMVLVYKNSVEHGLTFVEMTDKKYKIGFTPKEFYDSEEDYECLGAYDFPDEFLKKIGFKEGSMDITV